MRDSIATPGKESSLGIGMTPFFFVIAVVEMVLCHERRGLRHQWMDFAGGAEIWPNTHRQSITSTRSLCCHLTKD